MILKILAKGNNGGLFPAGASDVHSVASRVLLILAAAQLGRKIEHIKDIITNKQFYANGFTTRKISHGVGLHSCALAARDMGGTLTAHSDGVGLFALDLPLRAVEGKL